jgi:O-antigen ligase
MEKFVTWWGRGLIAALCVSVAMLGTGRMGFEGGGMSAWSVSRTTFFFWLAVKLLLLVRGGWAATGLSTLRSLAPLLLFFTAVTLSLLPDFHQAGDYRYFFFGCAHAVMLVDVFSAARQRSWLPWLLGLLPLILVARGLVHDPSTLNFDLSHRFSFPLDSWNTAGYVFSMSIPLCLLVAIVNPGWWRALGLLSCAGQMLALILTFSRGAWLGWTASMVYLGFTIKKWKYLAALAVLATTCVLVAPSLRNRVVTISRPQSDQSIKERIQLLKSSLQLGMENPVLGVGYGRGRLKENLRSRLQGTVLEDSPIWHTHNLYVELFAGTGLLGLLSFLWLIGQTLRRVSRAAIGRDGAERLMGFALAASWIAAIVTGVGDIPFYHHETRIFFFSLLALAHIYSSHPFLYPPPQAGEEEVGPAHAFIS